MIAKSSLQSVVLLSAFCFASVGLSGCGAVLLSGAGTAASTQVSQDSRNINTMLYDEGIEQKAYAILKSNALLSKPESMSISVTSFNGNVLVTGQTVNRDYLKWAVSEIEKLEHVRKVYNYATLQKPVPVSVVSSDSYITSRVRTALLFGKEINSNRFKVVTENGNVFLMGIVTKDEAKRAVNSVLAIDGVRRVYHVFDYIEVQSSSASAGTEQENLKVTPVKGNPSSYSKPETYGSPVYGSPVQEERSVNVPPVERSQNGGAYIIEETPVYTPPVSREQNGGAYIIEESVPTGGRGDLLAPAGQY